MEKVDRSLRRTLAAALISSILLVVGIPMLVIGATHLGAWGAGGIVLMVVGIVLAAVDFYAMPLLWVAYGSRRVLAQVVFCIERRGLSTVERLASHLRAKEDDVRSWLDACFQKGYLDDYVRAGDTVTRLVPAPDPTETEHDAECPSCAARFTYRGVSGRCPYCGTVCREKGR